TTECMSVRGKYQAPGSAEWQDFEISTSVAYGKLLPVKPIPAEAKSIRVNFSRDLSTMLNDLDFAEQTARKMGISIMRNLVENTQIQAESGMK
ncbi:MAG: hypothetical protein AAF512_06350, partial [Pseudomonadota bacterium]